jgi:hypothetical protein
MRTDRIKFEEPCCYGYVSDTHAQTNIHNNSTTNTTVKFRMCFDGITACNELECSTFEQEFKVQRPWKYNKFRQTILWLRNSNGQISLVKRLGYDRLGLVR